MAEPADILQKEGEAKRTGDRKHDRFLSLFRQLCSGNEHARVLLLGGGRELKRALLKLPFDIALEHRPGAVGGLGSASLPRLSAIDLISDYDCVILDASQPGLDLEDFFEKDDGQNASAHASAHECQPVIVIGAGLDALALGAAESLSANDVAPERLASAILNALRAGQTCRVRQAEESGQAVEHMPDFLTRLPSRAQFMKDLEAELARAAVEKRQVILASFDIDAFKPLNESLGLETGDKLLKAIADRLTMLDPAPLLTGRLGDDEFAVLLADAEELTQAASRLAREMKRPYNLNGHQIEISATIGLAPMDGRDDADRLMHKAMNTLYAAKREKACFLVHAENSEAERLLQLELAHDLKSAVANGELVLHYQPKLSLAKSQTVGVEALVRWQHPHMGLIFPDRFIPLAETSGNIRPLTEWVLAAAIEQNNKWREQGLDLTVSVNVSAVSLRDEDFPDTVLRILREKAFDPHDLILEITESAIIADMVRATETLNRLHALGVKLSIDDFGTGYTSLAYIRKLPVDEIKVDKSFVLNMHSVSDDAVIVRTLVELGHNLGLQVTAEGVEDRATWYMLSGLGCDTAQGYFMSRPIDAQALEKWIDTSQWAAGKGARNAAD